MGGRRLSAVVLLLAACGGNDQQSDGEVGGHCYPNATCNVGLTCAGGLCVPADAPETNADSDAPPDAASDAPPDAAPFVCSNDSLFESNDTLQTAYVTPVDVTQASITYAGLAICLSSDKDYFRVTLAIANSNLEAVASSSPGGESATAVAILNGAGATINNGIPAADPLKVFLNTTTVGGTYAPQNCEAVWIEDSVGTFVKTIGRWCGVRKGNLVAWTSKAGVADVDAVSGATRGDHNASLIVTWDLRDRLGSLVPDGAYTIRMETTESNATTSAENHQASFGFTKGPTSQVQTGLTNGGHTNVLINFQANPPTRAYAANLPAATYYVVVTGAPGRSNYSLTLTVSQ